MKAASDLAGHDLNLLLALHALLVERHVSRAARQIGVSQPAMSRTLARLRIMFDDPLLIRAGPAMQPTARALALLPELEEVLRSVRQLLRPVRFEPRQASGTVRIAAPDIIALMLAPPLLRCLAKEAPNLSLAIVPWQTDWRGQLESGKVDLTLGFPKGDEPNIYARQLMRCDWACVLRRGHPAVRKKWTLERYAALDHIRVSLAERALSPIDTLLAAHGHSRRVTLQVPYPAITPLLIEGSDLVLTTVRWLALKLKGAGDLVVRRPPIPFPPVQIPIVWHERVQRDPRQRWLRARLLDVAAALDDRKLRWS